MHVDDVVLQLGAVRPLVDPAEAAAAAVAMGQRAARLLRANRTVGMAARRLGPTAWGDHEFGREFAAHRDRIARRAPMIARSVEQVSDIGRELGIGVYGMKGLAVQHLYPDPVDRDVRDVDLWVSSVDTAGVLARELLRAGFEHDRNELPWIKRADGVTYGQIRLRPGQETHAPIDIHFGPYSVGHRGRLSLTDASAVRTGPIPLLAESVNLRATLGNATGDCMVTTKDLNDYSLVAARLPSWEWEEHVRLAARVGASRVLRTILHRLCRTQAVDQIVVERDRQLARRGVLPLRLDRLPDARYRTRATVRRAVVQADRTGEGHLVSTALSAWSYYRQPLQLAVVPHADRPSVASAAADRCLRLVPVEAVSDRPPTSPEDGFAGVLPLPTDHGELCRLAGVLYVPTISYELDAPLVEHLVSRSTPEQGGTDGKVLG